MSENQFESVTTEIEIATKETTPILPNDFDGYMDADEELSPIAKRSCRN